MTMIRSAVPTENTAPVTREDLRLAPVVLNAYRDIHKGIRSALFDLTVETGRTNPADTAARKALAVRFTNLAVVLEDHAGHEDTFVQPAVAEHRGDLAEAVERDHVLFGRRIYGLVALAEEVADVRTGSARHVLEELYLGAASFSSAYLLHQDFEERIVMPAMEAAIGVEAVVAIHEAIIASIPPQAMAEGLAMMLPAMNLEDRVEMLAGIRGSAPREAFEAVLCLAENVLGSPAAGQIADRLAEIA